MFDQTQCNNEELSSLRAENAQLRMEFDLLRSVVIRMDRRMSVLDDDITDLRNRSMREHILIHNFRFPLNEDPAFAVRLTIKQTLGVDVFLSSIETGYRR